MYFPEFACPAVASLFRPLSHQPIGLLDCWTVGLLAPPQPSAFRTFDGTCRPASGAALRAAFGSLTHRSLAACFTFPPSHLPPFHSPPPPPFILQPFSTRLLDFCRYYIPFNQCHRWMAKFAPDTL